VSSERTADFQTTTYMRQRLANQANADDLMAYMFDHNFPTDDIAARKLAERTEGAA
jgi:hypothetical protein